MNNLVWYICLAFIGVGSTTYAIYMKRDLYKISTLLTFYLFSASLTWIGEFIVLGIFNSYAYKTGVFSDPWAQNLLGHLILNTTLYPSAAIILVAYSLRYGWISFVAAFYTFLEYSFLKLDLYEQHWWRYYMTIIAVVVFLSIALKWFPKITEKYSGLTRTITFYFVALIIIHTPAPILLLLGIQYYQLELINHWANNLYLESIIIVFCYHLIESFILILFTCILKKWYWCFLPFIISIVAQSILVKMNILIIKENWNLLYTLIIYILFIALFIFIEKNTLKLKIAKVSLT